MRAVSARASAAEATSRATINGLRGGLESARGSSYEADGFFGSREHAAYSIRALEFGGIALGQSEQQAARSLRIVEQVFQLARKIALRFHGAAGKLAVVFQTGG